MDETPIEKPKRVRKSKPKKKQTFDFVGHIIYPNTEEIKKIFFMDNITKSTYTVKYEGEELSSKVTQAELLRFLYSQGFEIEKVVVPAPGMHKPKLSLGLDCDKKCIYADEKYHGQCKIKMRSTIENITESMPGNYKKKILVDSNIIVSFTARDMTELMKKSECITTYVYDICGIKGESDSYMKVEFC